MKLKKRHLIRLIKELRRFSDDPSWLPSCDGVFFKDRHAKHKLRADYDVLAEMIDWWLMTVGAPSYDEDHYQNDGYRNDSVYFDPEKQKKAKRSCLALEYYTRAQDKIFDAIFKADAKFVEMNRDEYKAFRYGNSYELEDIFDMYPGMREEIGDYLDLLNKEYIHKRDGAIKKLRKNGLTIMGVVAFTGDGKKDYKEILIKQGTSPAKSYYTGDDISLDNQKFKIIDASTSTSGGFGYMKADGTPGFSVEMSDKQNNKYYLYNLEKGNGTSFSDEMEAPEEVKDLFV